MLTFDYLTKMHAALIAGSNYAFVSESTKASLRLAMSALANLHADILAVQKRLEEASSALSRMIQLGGRLADHEFDSERYSKVTTAAVAANYRRARYEALTVLNTALADIEEHKALLSRRAL